MPVAKIVAVHRLVCDEYHAETSLRTAYLCYEARKETANTTGIDTMFALAVQQVVSLIRFHGYPPRRNSAPAVERSGRSTFRTPARFSEPEDDVRHHVR